MLYASVGALLERVLAHDTNASAIRASPKINSWPLTSKSSCWFWKVSPLGGPDRVNDGGLSLKVEALEPSGRSNGALSAGRGAGYFIVRDAQKFHEPEKCLIGACMSHSSIGSFTEVEE